MEQDEGRWWSWDKSVVRVVGVGVVVVFFSGGS